MKPAGIIPTYMSRKDWQGKSFWLKLRTIFFNLFLFTGQLTFLVVGTAYGKVKWAKLERIQDRAIGVIFMWAFIPFIWFFPKWWSIPILIIGAFIGIATFCNIDWRRVWRAAQCSHVRLVLEEADPEGFPGVYSCINFGYPKAEIHQWIPHWNDGKRFEYFDPKFDPSPEFIKAMIQYARDQVGKRYDSLQLFSYGLNFIVWLFWPPWWGKEKLKWLNLRGGREVCSSGVTACLRWAYLIRYGLSVESANKMISEQSADYGYIFFPRYDTAVVWPCLVPLSKNWEVT